MDKSKSKFSWFQILVPFLLACLGTFIFLFGAVTFYRDRQFSGGDVVHVSGTVTERSVVTSRFTARRNSTTLSTFSLSYRFQDSEGNEVDSKASVAGQTYDRLGRGSPLPIKYLLHYPAINRVDLPEEDSYHQSTASAFMLFGSVCGGGGWCFLLVRAKMKVPPKNRV